MRTMKKEGLIKRLEKVHKELLRLGQVANASLIDKILIDINKPLETLEEVAPVLSSEPGKPEEAPPKE